MRFLISCCVDQWKRMLTSRENISVEIYAGHGGCYVMPDAGCSAANNLRREQLKCQTIIFYVLCRVTTS